MSEISKETLELRLKQLKCHFTWKLLLKDTEPDELEDRLNDQLTFLVTKNKYMVYNLLAYMMHLKGDYPKAIANLEKAEEMIKENNPDGTDHRYLVTYGNYAWVFYYFNQYEESQKYIDKVEQIHEELKDTPGRAEIYGEKAWALLAFTAQHYEESKQCFEKALKLEPEDPEWNSGYATVVYRLEGLNGRKFPASECRSLELLKRAIEKNPNDLVVKALLALKLQVLRKPYIEEDIVQAPSNPYLLRYVAKFYKRAGMVDKALELLKTAIDLTPSSGALHHQTGLCYWKKYLYYKNEFPSKNIDPSIIEKTIFHFEKAVEYKKMFVFAYLDLAKAYREIEDLQKAEETYQAVLALSNLTDEERQKIYYIYGCFKERYMKSESEAIDCYKKSLQINILQNEREKSETALRRIYFNKMKNDFYDDEAFAFLSFVHKTKEERKDAIDKKKP
ncbi:interferon-induced protein with tetratricopeptide repeats 5-like [Dendropsophus ebraccatus]|uniref:interferon-induced protein with tetratricopeptide repeats 5-like n=1 Tax=Dendropsophus ebraccatus TaxID=150705 RepID=UPI0038310DF4